MCLDKVVNDTPVLVSAVDGLCFNIANAFVDKMFEADSDGGLIVFKSYNRNYSYVREANGSPIELVEKQNVSAIASTGIYYFRNKEFLVDSISWALLNKIEVDEKYYVSSAINKLIFENKKVSLFEIDESEYFRFSIKAEADDSIRRLNL
jgi:dTDP-glucose pyrophosphorylase